MIPGRQFLSDSFFARPVDEVAPDLVGCFLFTNFDGKKAGGMIIETEAYDQNDVFAHCFVGASDDAKGKSAPMSGEPGIVYLYWNGVPKHSGLAINVSCDRKDFGSAVLIRAVEPLDQNCAEVMRAYRLCARGANKNLRGDKFRTVLANGPGNVGDALGLDEPEYELAKRGQLTISRKPFELYHRSNSCSPVPASRKGLNKMYQRFDRYEPERASYKDAKAHLERQWRWVYSASS